jgi:outer membrane protein
MFSSSAVKSKYASLGLALLAFAATLPLAAQTPPASTPIYQRDGKPDPTYSVPDELSLPYALAFALDNNFDIRQARERIRQQEGILLEVRSNGLPNVSAGADYSRTDEELGGGDDQSWSYDITATQVLFSGGAVRASVRAQKLSVEAAKLELEAVINAALLEVRTRFYTVLVARERIKVQEQSVELLRRQLQDVRNRFEAGTVSNFEVLRAEVALANAQPPLISARNNYRLSIDNLRQSLGFVTADESNVARVPTFVGDLEFVPVTFDLASSLATARERRPDLLRLRVLEEAAEEGVVARRAGYLPNLGLFGSYQGRKAPGATSFSDNREGFVVGLQSSWNIFDGRATAGRVAQARSVLEQTKLSTSETELGVSVEVRRALSSLQEATELAEASKRVVEQAEEAARLAEARFSAGTATQLDVLTSQVDLTTSRLNQIEAYYRYNIAVATVRTAMGLSDAAIGAAE